MIRAFFGLTENPFSSEQVKLLPHQEEIYDTLRVHCQQGGLCMILGVPGTGKSMIKNALKQQSDSKKLLVVTVGRTLHTYTNTIKILCQAFNIDFDGTHFKCEKRLIEESFALNRSGRMLVTIIDDAHLLEMPILRRLRLLFEDFPKNHNVILVGQPSLLSNMTLSVNSDIKSRVTYSVMMPRLNPDDMTNFILSQLDRVKLGHNTFTEDALDLIVRSSDGVLRNARNLALSCLLEGVRAQTKIIGLDQVNRVLIQPHWRKPCDILQLG
jgi:type II secretory pathway predicted ATPase ExeA